MTSDDSKLCGAVSCIARAACVDVVLVVPALLNAPGTVDVDRGAPISQRRHLEPPTIRLDRFIWYRE